MFAVVKTGGKQYRVAKDDVIRVEKLDAEAGETVILDEVLMVSDENGAKTGTPLLEGAAVEAEVVEQTRNKKIIIYKKKRRQNYRRKKGHRQQVTVLKVVDISLDGSKKKAKAPAKAKTEAAPAAAEAKEAKKAAPKKAAAKKTAKKTAAKKAAAKKSDAE
ncbi:MAG: 50S ribosomal protein L21 [Alphaproteobacteria bacterium]|nr:50S ribosomal protein L21 [Alphaproteobacteria bacterium]